MSLSEYREKRRFSRSPEPKGRTRQSKGRLFVIQQHGARRLHFDLRLELGGTLKSWAVPKGLSLDPKEKRLAVHVEDHAIEYAGFEGTIPEGEYGAGAVIVWDRGEWEPLGDADRDYRKGELKFRLHGEKLNGAWMLVRLRRKEGEDADNWLVIKERDESAIPLAKFDIITERPESVLTKRTLAEVASAGTQSVTKRKRGKRGGSLNLLQQAKATAKLKGKVPLINSALSGVSGRFPLSGSHCKMGGTSPSFLTGDIGVKHQLHIDQIQPFPKFIADLNEVGDPPKARAFLQRDACRLFGAHAADHGMKTGLAGALD